MFQSMRECVRAVICFGDQGRAHRITHMRVRLNLYVEIRIWRHMYEWGLGVVEESDREQGIWGQNTHASTDFALNWDIDGFRLLPFAKTIYICIYIYRKFCSIGFAFWISAIACEKTCRPICTTFAIDVIESGPFDGSGFGQVFGKAIAWLGKGSFWRMWQKQV